MTVIDERIITYGVREVREIKAKASEVELIRPSAGMTTQADANKDFVERLDKVEDEVDGGTF